MQSEVLGTGLIDLASRPDSLRDAKWEQDFFSALVAGKVTIVNPQPQNGPDSWPYLFVKTEHQAREPFVQVMDWALRNGVGLAINVHKRAPDYIFPYGMLLNYAVRQAFYTAVDTPVENGEIRLTPGANVMVSPLTEQQLPDFARKILRQFLADQEIQNPRVMLLWEEQRFTLCFSLESLGLPSESDQKNLCEALSWFLPTHYPVAILSEKTLPHFTDL